MTKEAPAPNEPEHAGLQQLEDDLETLRKAREERDENGVLPLREVLILILIGLGSLTVGGLAATQALGILL